MGGPRNHRGFSLIGLLLSVAIVGILLVMALQTYQPALQSFETGKTAGESFGLTSARLQMRQLYAAEVMYFNIHRTYGSWQQLQQDGMIQRGYSNRAQGGGTPFIPHYDIDIQADATGFVITATPNPAAGAVEGAPILRIDQGGELEEIAPK